MRSVSVVFISSVNSMRSVSVVVISSVNSMRSVSVVWAGFELTTLVVIGTDCIGSNRSN
jgi:hypothetical protein